MPQAGVQALERQTDLESGMDSIAGNTALRYAPKRSKLTLRQHFFHLLFTAAYRPGSQGIPVLMDRLWRGPGAIG